MLSKKMHGKPLIYFDSAATTQKPQCVIDCLSDFYTNHFGTVHRAVYDLSSYATEQHQAARESVRKFLNAEKGHEIIFTRGTTESINLVAYSFGKAFIKKGDEVIISEIEHHSNIVPWQIMCEDREAILKIIPVMDSGELDLEKYEALFTDRTKLVAIVHVANALGTINPVKRMTEIAHQKGAKVLIDGAQSAPHQLVDVQDIDADFFAFSGHKLYGPTGIGVLYGKESLLEAMPPYQGGGDMIKAVAFEKTTYNELPLKFEAGTPAFAQAIGLGKAIEYLTSIGMENIDCREQSLLEYATRKLKEIEGLKIIGNAKEKGGIISFSFDGVHPLDIGTFLDLEGVAVRTGNHCNQPVMHRFKVPGTVRVSFGLYNDKDEIDDFVKFLKIVMMKLR